MKALLNRIAFFSAIGVVGLLVCAFVPDSSNFNVTQFLLTGKTISVAHLSASLVDSGTLPGGQIPAFSGIITTPGGSTVTSFGTFNSATLATALSDENGGGPALFSTGDGGGLTKLNGLSITNWPPASLMANPTGGSAGVIPVTLDSTLSFVAGQLHAIGGGSSGSASNAITQIFTNGVAAGPAVITNLNFNGSANIDVPATNGNGTVGITPTLKTNLTGIASVAFVGGGTIQGAAGATASGAFNRVAAGITNGMVNEYNVIDFGASPALADNSTAIQNTLNAASTNGGRVFIPAATNAYTCTSTINIPDGVTLFGDTSPYGGGNGNFSQIFNSSSALAVTFGNGSGAKNILFQGSGVNGTQIGIANRYTTSGISGYSFDGCLIKNFAIGMVLSNTWDGYFPNDTISACQRSVVFSNYANAITFVSGHYGSSAYATSIAFDVRGDDLQQKSNLSFIGCIMEVSSNSFCLRSGGGGWDNINISGYSEGSTNVIYASGGLNLNIDHLSFVQSGGSATTNIVLRGVKQVAMDHCYFFNSVAFDADSATFGLSFDKNYVESGVTWNDRATTSLINDNTNFTLRGMVYNGNGGGLSNLNYATLTNVAAGVLGSTANGNAAVVVPVTGGIKISGGNLTGIDLTNSPAVVSSASTVAAVSAYSAVGNNTAGSAASVNIPVSQTAVFPSSTNSVQLAPLLYGTNWLLQSATACNLTNAINGTAGYIFAADITISNSSGATFTTRVDTAWIPRGWLATNIGTGTLGFNGVTVAAAKEAFIHVEARGTIETNYWLSY